MNTQDIAVLCWQVAPDRVAGRLAFRPWDPVELVRKNPAGAVSSVEDVLSEGDGWPAEVRQPRIRRYTQRIRPSLRSGSAVLALPFELSFPFDVVVGELDHGALLCEIVPFGHLFQIDQASELDGLVAHFVREESATWGIDQILRWALRPPATLHEGRVRSREIEAWKRKKTPPKRLSAIAELLGAGRSAPLEAAFSREALVSEVADLIRVRSSVLLVGPPRVGKSAVLREAARQVGKTPLVWRTTADRLPAGARYLGEWQERCDELIADLETETAALWVDDLPRLLSLGGDGPDSSVAAYLRPALADGRIQLLGEITPTALHAVRARLPSFFVPFREVLVPELDEGALVVAGQGIAGLCRDRLGAAVEPDALALAVRLLSRHAREEKFPGKLADFLGPCASDASLAQVPVTRQRALEAFVRRTGLPPVLVDDTLPLDRPGLRAFLEKRVAGQPEAVATAVALIETFKAALNDPGRPVATLLFAGPTGVGKTATARALAEWTFGQGPGVDPLIRLDMSELVSPAQVSRLIGGADGEPGELVRRVRERPFSVLLLDEIEKAHPVFFDVLLGLLDEGRLTDGWGRVTDFCGAIVVLTTNLGVKPNSSVGFGQRAENVDLGEIRRFFRPEMLNRLDRIVRFAPLALDTVREIARRELAAVAERPGLRDRRIRLLYGESLVERVVAAGFDPALGARPLLRAVERWAVAPLAAWLLAHPRTTDVLLTLDVVGEQVIVG